MSSLPRIAMTMTSFGPRTLAWMAWCVWGLGLGPAPYLAGGAYGRDLFRLGQELQLDGVAESSTTYATSIADLNGDGALDIFQGNGFGGPNLVWLNDGHGVFADSGLRIENPKSTRSVGLADVNQDGTVDAVVAGTRLPGESSYAGASVLANPGFDTPGYVLPGLEAVAATLGDLNGDGAVDLFAGGWAVAGSSVWLNDGLGNFTDSQQNLGTSMVHDVALFDVDNDGDLDAYLATFAGVPDELWLNDGQGKLSDSGARLGGDVVTQSVVAADFNGDGWLDALVGGDGLQVFLNDGQGSLSQTQHDFGAGLSIPRLATGDFNGDGSVDVLAAVDNGPSQAWLNEGTGRFVDSGMRIGVSEGRSVGVADFNGDGWLDFVLGTEDASPTAVWFGLNPRDLDLDGKVSAADIDALARNLGGDPSQFDLDLDGVVDQDDLNYFLTKVLHVAPGDADLDGDVDLSDFGLLKANFAQPGKGWADGDFNGNSVPDLVDFGLLKENFGRGTAGGAAAVPEPEAWRLALLGVAGLGLAWRTRRRRAGG